MGKTRFVVTFKPEITDLAPCFANLVSKVDSIESMQKFIGTAIVFASDKQVNMLRENPHVFAVSPVGKTGVMI